MSIESDADRLGLVTDFGVTATVNGAPVTGIFDDRFLMITEHGEQIESAAPQLTCRSSDVANVTHGMSCVVNGVTYTIRSVEPDGTGMTRLILHK